MSTDPHALVSVAPDAAPPEWTLPWVNIWIDPQGGQHWTRYSHGTSFEGVFKRVTGRPVDRDERNWMYDHIGSVADPEEEDDNPGWQYNQLATRGLGWIRIKGYHLETDAPTWTVTCDEGVTREALDTAVRLLSAQPRNAQIEVSLFGDFANELAPGLAIRELREIAEDAPSASGNEPDPDHEGPPGMRR